MNSIRQKSTHTFGFVLAAIAMLFCVGLAMLLFRDGERTGQAQTAGMVSSTAQSGGDGAIKDIRYPVLHRASEVIEPVVTTPVSPEMQAQHMRLRASDLDQNFMETLRTQSWAGPMEDEIRRIVDQSGFVGEEKYGITQRSVECWTHGCKISLGFGDDRLADEATMLVRAEIADDFNQTLTVPLQHPNGSVEYLIYTAAPGHGNLLRKRHPDQLPISPDSPLRDR